MNHAERKQQILDEAESMGIPTKDLKILTTDPYLVGTEGEYRDAQWAANLWDQMMSSRQKPLHIRGFHYWVQSRRVAKPTTGEIYGNDPMKDWRWLMKACQVARYLGVGGWRGLVDMKHPDVADYDDYESDVGFHMSDVSIGEVIKEDFHEIVIEEMMSRALLLAPKYGDEGYQTYHTEVWCEKNTMKFIIDPLCKRYGAAYQPLVGQASVEKVDMLARRILQAVEAEKKVRIWYIADWDRYGWNMVTAVARKLEFIIVSEGIEADVKLTRLALNDDQITHYDLPKAPKLGEAVVELDALEAIYPGELSKIIRRAIFPYVDSEGPQTVREENQRMEERLSQILEEKLRPVLEEALKDVEIRDVEIDLQDCVDEEFIAPERDHEVDEDDGSWVYDSSRDWFEQLDRFKEYKESREEEAA